MSSIASLVAKKFSNSREAQKSFAELIAFLKDHPEYFGWRGKKMPNLNSENGIAIVAEKYFSKRHEKTVPSIPTTVPDPMVSLIMVYFYGHSEANAEKIKIEHQHSMAAENIVGELLEKYLAENIESLGWVWCPASLVKHTDFIKKTGNDWVLLQVKNRDNSENSSSAAIRGGTEIIKWFRTYSRTGESNWENFPDSAALKILSENDFKKYVINLFKN
jgi:hypothetical protein